MRFSTNILRSVFSLMLLMLFLFGAGISSHVTTVGAKSESAAQKQSQEDQTIVKPSVSPEATVSVISIKFHQTFCDFIRQYVVQVNTVRITDFGYPVFRNTYFSKIFSHLIVINAP